MSNRDLGRHRGKQMTHPVPQLLHKLLVARQAVRAVLHEARERPELKRRLSIFLDDVQVRVVHAAPALPRLLDDRAHALCEVVLDRRERRQLTVV
jgi:hypothetical protein